MIAMYYYRLDLGLEEKVVVIPEPDNVDIDGCSRGTKRVIFNLQDFNVNG